MQDLQHDKLTLSDFKRGNFVVFCLPNMATYLGIFQKFVEVEIDCGGIGKMFIKKAVIRVARNVCPSGEIQLPIIFPCWISPTVEQIDTTVLLDELSHEPESDEPPKSHVHIYPSGTVYNS